MPSRQAQLDRPNPGHRVVQLVHDQLQDLSRELRKPLLFMSNFFRQQLDMPETLRRDGPLPSVACSRSEGKGYVLEKGGG